MCSSELPSSRSKFGHESLVNEVERSFSSSAHPTKGSHIQRTSALLDVCIAMDKVSSLYRIPQSPLECIDPKTGEFDIDVFILYRRRSELAESFDELQAIIDDDDIDEDDDPTNNKNDYKRREKLKKTRGVIEHREQRIYRCPIDGRIKPLGPKNTPWFTEYLESPNITSPSKVPTQIPSSISNVICIFH